MRLVLFDNFTQYDSKCDVMSDGSFRIFVDKNNKIEDYFKNPNIFLKVFDENDYIFQDLNFDRNKIVENVINSEEVELCFYKTNIINFIENNEYLKNKKIILKGIYLIDEIDRIEKEYKKYNKYKDRIYIRLEGNYGFTNIETAYETVKQVKDTVSIIKQLNLSPIEAVMLAYDEVRKRVYTAESEDESYKVSRDISSVLNGDKIVCKGYSIIFKAITLYLGLNCDESIWDKKNSNSSHARNIMYIKDDKYNIDGVYYFDTTWDSKKNETNDYLDKYLYFAKSKREMDFLSENYIPDFVYSEELIENCINDLTYYLGVDRIDPVEFMSNIRKKYLSLNIMSEIVEQRRIITEINGCVIKNHRNLELVKENIALVIKELKNIDDKFKYAIPFETMMQVFNNVRKIEYYINPDLYKYDVENMVKIAKKSVWLFTKKYRFFHSLFSDNNSYEDMVRDYITESGIDKDVENIHLTKILRNYLNNK